MTLHPIDLHLKYIGVTEVDVVALRGVKALIEQNADSFVDRFYAHLKTFEGTRAFLSDEQVVRRLLAFQRDYILSLFDAKFDVAYYDYRRRIGQTHFRIGLDFQWYIGAYALYMELTIPLVMQYYAADRLKYLATSSAIRKAVLLDMTIVLESYHENDKAALEATQAQVLHQEKLAAVGLLASGIAHEIGNPLASILAVCDNQLRKHGDDAVAEKFKRIREQVMRMTKIVRQIVTYARPDPASWQPVNLNDVLETSLGIARLARDAKRVEVNLKLDAALPSPNGVADQLGQVFLNLFLNAMDAINEDNGTLTISSFSADGQLHVSVNDTGHGIPAEHLPNLFKPFFSTKASGKGTGLGLHISDTIIQRHGGKIMVQSEVGKGTTLTVILPLNQPDPSTQPQQRTKPA